MLAIQLAALLRRPPRPSAPKFWGSLIPASPSLPGVSDGGGSTRGHTGKPIGPLERSIIDLASRLGGYVRPSDAALALGVDRRRAHDALRRLEARGLVRRVSRGLYALAAKESAQGQARTAAKESTGAPDPWLGPLEYRIASYVLNNGLRRFTLSELSRELGVDARRVFDALGKLSRRGLVRRVARGLYEVVGDPARLAALPVRPVLGLSLGAAKESRKAGQGTRGPAAARDPPTVLPPAPAPLHVDGPLFDNVRGYTHDGRYVEGDRGRQLRPEDLALFESVSYAEVGFVIDGLWLPDHTSLVVYADHSRYGPGRAKAELRPGRGYVKRNGVASATRLTYVAVARVAYAASYLTLTRAPPDVARWLRRQLSALLGCAG